MTAVPVNATAERLRARTSEIRHSPRPWGPPRAPAEVAVPDDAPVAARAPQAVAARQAEREASLAEMIGESLKYARRVLTRHAEWPDDASLDTALLWCLHANARQAGEDGLGELIWRVTPRLLITSGERGSGKSTVLALIAKLCGSRFGVCPKITGPAFAKMMGKFREPVFIDEARMVFGSGTRSAELQAMMLAGYTAGATVLTGHIGKTEPDTVFGPVAYAGKDNLITEAGDSVADLLDRSLIIRMRRASRHYPDIDETAEDAAALACKGMRTWAGIKRAELLAAVRRLSAEAAESGDISSESAEAGALRSAQIWRPLLATADVIGGEWPERARRACEELSQPMSVDSTGDFMAELDGLRSALFDDEDEL